MEDEVAAEIERLGLTDLLIARYLHPRRVIRIARRTPEGAGTGGIDYPLDAGVSTIREHLRLYRKLRDVWE